MREILFRGKRKDNGEWIYGDLLHDRFLFSDENICVIYNVDSKLTHRENIVIPETVGQYTGLTDRNGTKIFEGDIVRDKTNGVVYKIFYCNESGMFIRKAVLRSSLGNPLHLEVIGNIHDNP